MKKYECVGVNMPFCFSLVKKQHSAEIQSNDLYPDCEKTYKVQKQM